MKILIAQDYLRSGGTERQSILLANAFAAAGHTVTLLTFRPGGPLAPTVARAVTLSSLQPFDTHLDWFAPGLSVYLGKHPPDIALCMGRMANCYGQSFVRQLRVRSPHSVVIATMRTGKKLPRLFRSSLRQVHHIIANSRAAQQVLAHDHHLPVEKISVIHNSLIFPSSLSAPLSDRAQLRSQHHVDDTTTVLLDVAMFRPEKNQRELVEIAAGLPADFPWQLWLAGDGPALGACRQRAQQLEVADRVKFFGHQRDPAALYAAADVAVHASRSESLSNFLIEAQAHGLPAVAYAAQGIDECMVVGDTGVAIAFDDQSAFRRAIQHFVQPDAARRARTQAFARTTFDPARQVQAYLDLFHRSVKP